MSLHVCELGMITKILSKNEILNRVNEVTYVSPSIKELIQSEGEQKFWFDSTY